MRVISPIEVASRLTASKQAPTVQECVNCKTNHGITNPRMLVIGLVAGVVLTTVVVLTIHLVQSEKKKDKEASG